MDALLKEYIPHAPKLGLYVAPNIPKKLLRNARSNYAPDVAPDDVLVLYDATLLKSGKDGALFLPDQLICQNNALQAVQLIRYADIVGVHQERKWLGGVKVQVDVNQGRATVTHAIDFSGKKKAAPYVTRFLQEAMVREARPDAAEPVRSLAQTDVAAVRDALEELVDAGQLTKEDFEHILSVLG